MPRRNTIRQCDFPRTSIVRTVWNPNFAARRTMALPLFYCPGTLYGILHLPEEEAHHARSVLRLSPGARIGLLDGKGTVAEAVISTMDKRQLQVAITSTSLRPRERKARIHLAVGLTKQMERFEWMLEKSTEIGVDRITPLITDRTERTRLRKDRLERILVGAMKQSQRAWLPVLDEMMTINDLVDQGIPVQRLFGWCEGRPSALATCYRPGEDAVLLIGPEGDFTPEEATMLTTHGFGAVSLGKARLRTETAAISSCAYMNLAQQV
ncbi:MAG: 16S rRNA (uracil(1498)-N(3))-methyltransferase [Bacteroidetes bacterium]|nr:16S rRNA (uracil(1498)-N(3))-methyltransferase [Bacteroidota bacterium]MBX7130233.1 16S rRNA (uracil(1498)-N(3))-methyltransferase [Flavobacteriales bacterium]HMU13545.1 RsmE family RNA methyltransferase [Flavobacteriales bacterium]HMW95806.1 RsmE family RNA methyltransferase [Flavobacteriales bacterium]HNI03915.1 RsmE family RNA methyltransferase [Flavobacteriales bacterium]